MFERLDGDESARWQHQRAVGSAALRDQASLVEADAPQQPVREVVVREATALERCRCRLEPCGGGRSVGAAEMREQRRTTTRQGVVKREVQQNVVICSPRLQKRLGPRDVFVQRGEVVPPGTATVEFNRRIELPPGPRRRVGRIGRAVIDDVVDASDEEVIDGRADVGKRRPEVFAQPCGRLRRDEPASRDIRRGGRPLEARDFGPFGLGDIACGVEVEQIRRGPVRLVSHGVSAAAGPRGPLGRKGFEQEIGDRLPIIRERPNVEVGVARSEQGRQVLPEIVAATFLELVEKHRRPVPLPRRVIHLVRVVEEGAQAAGGMRAERPIEPCQVCPNCIS